MPTVGRGESKPLTKVDVRYFGAIAAVLHRVAWRSCAGLPVCILYNMLLLMIFVYMARPVLG